MCTSLIVEAYVAISRSKSLHTLYLLDFDPKSFRCHPDVVR